jgi:ArsR family transcriptional regulator
MLDRAPSSQQLMARRCYALGDETRLDILGLLDGCERCVCELTARLDAAQSRLSFHLKVLKDAGLISHRKQGRWSYYAIVPMAFREVEDFLREVRTAAGPAAAAACGADGPGCAGGSPACAAEGASCAADGPDPARSPELALPLPTAG